MAIPTHPSILLARAKRAREEAEANARKASQAPKEVIREVIRESIGHVTITIEGVSTPYRKTLPSETRHKDFVRVLRAITCDNVFLVGPAGSGKTTLAKQIAEALGVPFYFTGAINSEYKLSGFIDAHGRIISTAFRKAWEFGGLFLFDEIDASSPNAVLAFNAPLANGYADFPDGSVERHPDFHAIAAANTFGTGATREYVGRNQLDAATLDRFAFIEMGYDETLETTLAIQANEEHGEPWAHHVQRIRGAVNRLRERIVVSPRASIGGAKLLKAGATWEETEQARIFRGVSPDIVLKIKREAGITDTI